MIKRLLRSKRGQIPIVSDIINGIRSFVSWFFQSMPKPLLAVFFLFFILLLGNFLLPMVLNGMGYHCDTNHNVWKVSGLNVLSNFDLIRKKPDYDSPNLENVPFLCSNSQMPICTNCTKNITIGLAGVCSTDGYRPDEGYNVFRTLSCVWIGCGPDEGYFYNLSADVFQCYESFCMNKTLDDYNDKLYSIEGATPVYGNESSRTAESMIFFKCQERNPTNIRLTIFGIDVFDYRVWIALFVLGAIFYAMSIAK